ncbi:hypothetical protein Tco_1570489 [Tanacetum coccineum]
MIGCEVIGSFCSITLKFKFLEDGEPIGAISLGILFAKRLLKAECRSVVRLCFNQGLTSIEHVGLKGEAVLERITKDREVVLKDFIVFSTHVMKDANIHRETCLEALHKERHATVRQTFRMGQVKVVFSCHGGNGDLEITGENHRGNIHSPFLGTQCIGHKLGCRRSVFFIRILWVQNSGLITLNVRKFQARARCGTLALLREADFSSTSTLLAIMTGNLCRPPKFGILEMGRQFLSFNLSRVHKRKNWMYVSQTLSSVWTLGDKLDLFLDLEGEVVVHYSRWLLDLRCHLRII